MKLHGQTFAGALFVAALLPSHAMASTVVYTDAAAFNNAVSSSITYSFPTSVTSVVDDTSYTLGPATFSSDDLVGYNDAYGSPYLASVLGSPLSVTTSASAIGFFFGSYFDPQTISYSAGSASGIFAVPGNHDATAFLGFTGLSGPVTLTFGNEDELDATRIVAGVPEPATWAMMLVGFAAVGAAMRRQRKQDVRVKHGFA